VTICGVSFILPTIQHKKSAESPSDSPKESSVFVLIIFYCEQLWQGQHKPDLASHADTAGETPEGAGVRGDHFSDRASSEQTEEQAEGVLH